MRLFLTTSIKTDNRSQIITKPKYRLLPIAIKVPTTASENTEPITDKHDTNAVKAYSNIPLTGCKYLAPYYFNFQS